MHLLVDTKHNHQMNVDLMQCNFGLGYLFEYMKQVLFHYQLVYNFELLYLLLNVMHYKLKMQYQLLYSELFDPS